MRKISPYSAKYPDPPHPGYHIWSFPPRIPYLVLPTPDLIPRAPRVQDKTGVYLLIHANQHIRVLLEFDTLVDGMHSLLW